MIDGAPANSEHVMPDGSTYVFANGVLSEIREEEVESEEMKAIRQENETLKQQLADKEADITNQATVIKEIEKELKSIKNTIKSAGVNDDGKTNPKPEPDTPVNKYEYLIKKTKKR